MAQARRNRPKSTKKTRQRSSGLGMLLTGMVIGSVLTTLFLGWKKDPDHGIGSGINQMIAKSRQPTSELADQESSQVQNQSQKNPSYDFYTILPEIEQVIPEEYIPAVAEKKPVQPAQEKTPETRAAAQTDHYLLQAGSFAEKEQANQLKAKLALSGYESYIQKVTVDGKKFYRVRMGPYRNLNKLDAASKDLGTKGINAMRIKVSQG